MLVKGAKDVRKTHSTATEMLSLHREQGLLDDLHLLSNICEVRFLSKGIQD